MFQSFIYLDTDKCHSYKRQLDGKNSPNLKTTTVKNSNSINGNMKFMGGSAVKETEVHGEFEQDESFYYNQFEKELSKLDGEDFFDFVLHSEYDLNTVPSMCIIRLNSNFSVPEEFDMIKTIEQFKPMLMGQIQTQSNGEQEALNSIIGNASADIPIVIEHDDITVTAKLNSNYLCEEYTNLENYFEEDVYILCKTVGIINKENVEIFDPLKDFIKLPRAMRRQMDQNDTSGLEKINIEGPVLKVEIIAIYK